MEIRGTWESKRVWIDDLELTPEWSQQVRNHSADGFSWGYGGNGPAQLALALLLELTSEDLALLWYQDVKWNVIARLPQDDFVIDSQQIFDFIASETNTELLLEGRSREAQYAPEADEIHPAMKMTAIDVDFRYTREDLQAIFDVAHAEDVERGGPYDARSGAITVYTHPWDNETMRAESTMIGTFSAAWGQGNCIWQAEVEEGFAFEDLLAELGTLEEKALGRKFHGR